MPTPFSHLSPRWPTLQDLADQASAVAPLDPVAAALRLRIFAEKLVEILIRDGSLPIAIDGNQFERLGLLQEGGHLPRDVLADLHAIRIVGNKAAHEGTALLTSVDLLIERARALGRWLHERLAPDDVFDIVSAPPPIREAVQPDSLPSPPILTLMDAFSGSDLTADQVQAIERLQSFLDGKEAAVFHLGGYAGTGKTFLAKGLAEYLLSTERHVCLAAPTGRAARVLARKTGISSASTIHRLIYSFKDQKEFEVDSVEGTETFRLYASVKMNSDPSNTVYLIDEASMVSDIFANSEFYDAGSGRLLGDLLEYIGLDNNDHTKKIIFIGDRAQLPPVRMKFSPALDAAYLRETYGLQSFGYELRDVVRQSEGSGILANVLPLRQSLESGRFDQLGFAPNGRDVRVLGTPEITTRFLEVDDPEHENPCVIITRSNGEAVRWNRAIRARRFPGQCAAAPGDRLIVIVNGIVEGTVVSNGDFVQIEDIATTSEQRTVTLRQKNVHTGAIEAKDIDLSFRRMTLRFSGHGGSGLKIEPFVIENLLYDNQPDLTSQVQKALYVDFCKRHSNLKRNSIEFQEQLRSDPYFNAVRVKFGYAITCHKAQGGEWEHVIVSCPMTQDLLSSDSFRWLYTALTRAKQHLYLLRPPRIGLRPATVARADGLASDEAKIPRRSVSRPWPVASNASPGPELATPGN